MAVRDSRNRAMDAVVKDFFVHYSTSFNMIHYAASMTELGRLGNRLACYEAKSILEIVLHNFDDYLVEVSNDDSSMAGRIADSFTADLRRWLLMMRSLPYGCVMDGMSGTLDALENLGYLSLQTVQTFTFYKVRLERQLKHFRRFLSTLGEDLALLRANYRLELQEPVRAFLRDVIAVQGTCKAQHRTFKILVDMLIFPVPAPTAAFGCLG
jgi:hypothetical protein